MTDLIELTTAIVAILQGIPELVLELGGDAGSIQGYIDETPQKNSLARAVYTMSPGSILVTWVDTTLAEGEMEGFEHRVHIHLKAMRGRSPLRLIDLVMDGIPVPGDGLRWRYGCVLPGILPAQVGEVARLVDEEGIDYPVIEFLFKEMTD